MFDGVEVVFVPVFIDGRALLPGGPPIGLP